MVLLRRFNMDGKAAARATADIRSAVFKEHSWFTASLRVHHSGCKGSCTIRGVPLSKTDAPCNLNHRDCLKLVYFQCSRGLLAELVLSLRLASCCYFCGMVLLKDERDLLLSSLSQHTTIKVMLFFFSLSTLSSLKRKRWVVCYVSKILEDVGFRFRFLKGCYFKIFILYFET